MGKDKVIKTLEIEVERTKRRTIAAEAVSTNHDERVAELQDLAAFANNSDAEARTLTKKMASQLYEKTKKMPGMEKEIANYKTEVASLRKELKNARMQVPMKDVEIKKVEKD